jgi:16S rRNA (cytosine967-C5)-methyltransferase
LYNDLGKDIDTSGYIASLLKQPDVFIRIRPGKTSVVENQLLENQVQFKKESPNCLRLSSGTSVEKLLKLNREAVIQDLNSQKVFDYLNKHMELDWFRRTAFLLGCMCSEWRQIHPAAGYRSAKNQTNCFGYTQ